MAATGQTRSHGNGKDAGKAISLPHREPVVRGDISSGGFLFSYDRPDAHVVPIGQKLPLRSLKTVSEKLADQDLVFCAPADKVGYTVDTVTEPPFKTFLSLKPKTFSVDEWKHQYSEHRPPLRSLGAGIMSPRYTGAFQTGPIHHDEPLNGPLGKSTSLAWAGCSNGAKLAYANTAVKHREALDFSIRLHLDRGGADDVHIPADVPRSSNPSLASCNASAMCEEKASAAGNASVAGDSSSGSRKECIPAFGKALGESLEIAENKRTSSMGVNQASTPPPTCLPLPKSGCYQRWSNCIAVGPSEAWLDLHTEGRYFEVVVDVKKDCSTSQREADACRVQRPLIQLGATSIAAADGFGTPAQHDPYEHRKQCWLLSTTGHVFAEAATTEKLHIEWPMQQERGSRTMSAGSVQRMRLGLLVSEAGSLHLFLDGRKIAASAHHTLPVPLARTVGALFPIVVLGPNITIATLKRASCISP